MGPRPLVAAAACLVAAGCGSVPAPAPPSPRAAAKPPALTPIDATVLATLAEADAVDGAADGTVGNCLMCALSMPGLPDHVSRVGDFTLLACGAGCKEAFDADPGRFALLVRIPEPNPVYPD